MTTTASSSAATRGGLPRWTAAALLGAVLAVVLVRAAWLSDDAFITFRAIDNLLAGHGPVSNPPERVQAFTHPLWMLLVTGLVALTGEFFHTVMLLSLALTGVALLLATGVVRAPASLALVLLALLFSRAFVDYASSGLETPLTYLLLVAFLRVYLHPPGGAQGRLPLLWISLVAALAALNRLDALLLLAPALAHAAWRERSWRGLGQVALGFAPLAAWLAFAVVFYGFPLPNTAYAKLVTDIPRGELVAQGLLYARRLVTGDPVSAALLAGGLAAALLRRRPREMALATGLALHVLYVTWIGGDFMEGRFFAPPVLAGALLLGQVPLSTAQPGRSAAAAASVLALGLVLSPRPALFSAADCDATWEGEPPDGITDERVFYQAHNALRPCSREPHPWLAFGAEARELDARVIPWTAVGMFAFAAGPEKHVVDVYGLTDPLLARLPAQATPNWRIGHFERVIPDGYLETLRSGENQIRDPALRAYYDHLSRVTRGPLFSRERWQSLLALNLGHLSPLIDRPTYRHPNEHPHRPPAQGPPATP